MRLDRLDHLVLTVRDIAATVAFYTDTFGMRVETFGDGRTALHFGVTKINLHQAGREFEPKASVPTPGSADLCFVVAEPIDDIVAEVRRKGIITELGPVRRTGASGSMSSIYLRDPDLNLIELASYRKPDSPS